MEELIEEKKRGSVKMKPNLMLCFNDWDFVDYKLSAKNEMELCETHCPEMLKLSCIDSCPYQLDRFAK